MAKFQAILGIILIAGSLSASTAEIPKPGYTRTMLKVARNLPGETEELKVRTSEGNVATLIVKRREKSGSSVEKRLPQVSQETKVKNVSLDKSENISLPLSRNFEQSAQARNDEIKRSESQQIEEIRVKTSMENLSTRSEEPELMKISTNRSSEINSSEGTTQGTLVNERIIDYGNWTPLSKDGRALVTYDGNDEKYSSWKPVRTSPEIIPNDRTNFAGYQIPSNRRDGSTFGRNFRDNEANNYEADGVSRGRIVVNQPTQYAFLPHQSRPLTRTNIGANLSKNRGGKNVPPEVTVRSEINVKSLPKRTPMSMDTDGTPIIHGTRVPDEPMDKIQTWRNARVINNKLISESTEAETMEPTTGNFYASESAAERQRFERFFKDVNRRYGRNFADERNVYFEWDPKTSQNSALNAEIYETRNENYRSNIQKRMLHPENHQIYPNSQIYTPESQKISPLALKPGARAPVLQYAHPELGVQPAKILKNTEKRRPENFPDNQNSFTEQRHKKKYVLNDKNVVDSYTLKNYYPNQYFYGLKQPIDQPFWMKISENLRNQFSTGVERVSQLTRPVFDPLVEATQKISQNLGLSRVKEAQDKIGTVATGGSILIPALGLVASGAALGIGAVAVGRYLDVDMLKRGRNDDDEGNNKDDDLKFENSRALDAIESPLAYVDNTKNWNHDQESMLASGKSRSYEFSPKESYDVRTNPRESVILSDSTRNDETRLEQDDDGVFVILEETDDKQRIENRQTKPLVDESVYVDTSKRQRRSVDNENLVNIEETRHSAENERLLRRTGLDSLLDIIEIDVPTRGNIDIADITRKFVEKNGQNLHTIKNDVESNLLAENNVDTRETTLDDLLQIGTIADERILNGHGEIKSRRRNRRNIDSDRELNDALQNLENAEVSEAAHIDGDWTNTPCAKRIFCDAMIQRGHDATIFMEKKMDALLGLIQPGAALQVSSHFQEVMEAVRRHDCSSFLCPQARPGNVFF